MLHPLLFRAYRIPHKRILHIGGRRIALVCYSWPRSTVQDGDKHYLIDNFAVVYDPSQDRLKSSVIVDKTFSRGWLDDSHILIETNAGVSTHYFNEDVSSGKQTEIPKPTKMPAVMGNSSAYAVPK